ncbi:transcriptional regulator [Desulfofundulus thermobenzoicus]|uniref:Transcriptional regulator n=1 Tax=Desulfofundulus thermobenzoicus TaxID=29376 RepID=A0A6N7IMY0_9FIRM|nr:helix-turn-helix transcriptional regulator [Desulfofundulus thermobenzoicus]MQL51345.1 transcriptional regulator [Desulfofundulus thermobenzoicus]HHW42650.1 transcriptional regulator [Desulfotomaculum sp.]
MARIRETMLENLKSIARVVAETFGRNCEVAVHDLQNLEHSLVYLAGNVTKRQPGAPVTDLVVKVLRRKANRAEDLVNYKTITRDGRLLKSSTIFIRDDRGEIFAALCLNFDLTDLLNFHSLCSEFCQVGSLQEDDQSETFAVTVQETIESLISQAIDIMGKQPVTMKTEDKVRLVGLLEEKGAFLIKGAVDYVAAVLGVSKFTVYNYLKRVRSTRSLNIE